MGLDPAVVHHGNPGGLVAAVNPTPKFGNPPVVETLLGVQFAPLASFSLPHFGLFWADIRGDYPHQETKPPLGPQFEEFGTGMLSPDAVRVMLLQDPEARCWFIDSSRSQLIQVQRDRFVRNWRKVTGQEAYPEYEYLKPRFEVDWRRFCDFLVNAGIETPEVNQCEVTYINHIPLGIGFESLGEIHKVLSVVAPPSVGFLPEPEVVTLNNRYLMPDKRGRLHVSVQPAVRKDDNQVVLQLTLTARGRPDTPGTDGVLRWFDIGHEWITRGFADLTTSEMHLLWRRER